jgi:hypothetical protein
VLKYNDCTVLYCTVYAATPLLTMTTIFDSIDRLMMNEEASVDRVKGWFNLMCVHVVCNSKQWQEVHVHIEQYTYSYSLHSRRTLKIQGYVCVLLYY